jgi:hypothetical protein
MEIGGRMKYPGYLVKKGNTHPRIVRAVQRRLNKLGCGPVHVDGRFDTETRSAVTLFQARATDLDNHPLKIDGVVGPLTWAALFGEESLPTISDATSSLLATTLRIAYREVGVLEDPPGTNRGERVDEYIRAVDLDPDKGPVGGYAWCACFVYWCFERSAKKHGIENPVVKTAGVLDHWAKAGKRGERRILTEEVLEDIRLLKPGLIFIINTGGRSGHTGLVEAYERGNLITIEGNTNEGGSGEGIGVFRRTGRKLQEINRGYIDYSVYG